MLKRHFTIDSKLSVDDAIFAISSLLSKRSIKYRIEGYAIVSTSVPVILISYDKRQYSRDNWVGINPFIFVDTLKINVRPHEDDESRIDIVVIHIRPYVPLLIIVAIAISVEGTGNDLFVKLFFLTIAVLFYLFAFKGAIGRLLPSEIRRVI